MQKILYLDTTNNQQVVLSINQEKNLTIKKKVTFLKAQIVLPIIEKLIKTNGLKLSEITEIKVHTGPGSFTGIRVGLSVANALAYALGIKVNGKKLENKAIYT